MGVRAMAMYYKGKELPPGEPLPDELAIRILTNLYRCAALSQGLDPDELEIEITKKEGPVYERDA